jgi:hypothetical protein
MLLIKKPDGGHRLCADLRFLNTKVTPLHYSTPLLRDALQTIGASRATVMSTIDIKHAFYSLKIHPSSRRFLTIAPYPGARTMQYKRLTQGLNTSPTEWMDGLQRVLSKIPNCNKFCIAIADDIIIYSKNNTEHLKNIKDILKVLGDSGLKISPNKCQFFKKSLEYMGHTIECVGRQPSIKPQKSKIDSIVKLKAPKTRKQ